MILSTVWGASWVCSVPKTRCPVSAAVTASAMVSRSRISPTSITSGSCLKTCLRAWAKLLVLQIAHDDPELHRFVEDGLSHRSPPLRACADRLATFHTCRFSERLNGLLISL